MVGGNTAALIPDYLDSFEAIAADIDKAQRYVHLEYFIFVHDKATKPIFEALRQVRESAVWK